MTDEPKPRIPILAFAYSYLCLRLYDRAAKDSRNWNDEWDQAAARAAAGDWMSDGRRTANALSSRKIPPAVSLWEDPEDRRDPMLSARLEGAAWKTIGP